MDKKECKESDDRGITEEEFLLSMFLFGNSCTWKSISETGNKEYEFINFRVQEVNSYTKHSRFFTVTDKKLWEYHHCDSFEEILDLVSKSH